MNGMTVIAVVVERATAEIKRLIMSEANVMRNSVTNSSSLK